MTGGSKPKTGRGNLPTPGDVLDQRYRLGDIIATGGMGVIMSAKQIRTGRTVAVKFLHAHIAEQPDFAQRFAREARVGTLFDHTNIVRVYDVGETPHGALYLVMEYVEGKELKTIIARDAPMCAGEVLELGSQIADGLAEAHAKQVVHRDIKPANIIITHTRRGRRQPKILDFGLAKLVNTGTSELTGTGMYAGTPAYIAPETLVDDGRTDQPTVDVYSTGLVLLEMLTGRKAFEGENIAKLFFQQVRKPVPIPRKLLDTSLGEVIRKATEKHPDDRYTDADQLYAALKRAEETTPPELRLKKNPLPPARVRPGDDLGAIGDEALVDSELTILREVPAHRSYDPPGDEHAPTKEFDAATKEFDAPTKEFDASTKEFNAPGDDATPTTIFDPAAVAAPGGPDQPAAGGQPAASGDTTPRESTIVLRDEDMVVVDPPELSGTDKTRVIAAICTLVFLVVSGAFVTTLIGEEEQEESERDAAGSQLEQQDSEPADQPDEQHDDGPSDALFRVIVDTDPTGASVYDGQTELGESSLDLEFNPDDIPETVTIEKDGYETETRHLGEKLGDDHGADTPKIELSVQLQQVPEPEPEPTSAPQPSPPPPSPDPSPPSPTGQQKQDSDDDNGSGVDDVLRQYLD